MSQPILAIDQGTSSTKACVYQPPGRLLGAASVPVARRTPKAGAVEQDPIELVESCERAAQAAMIDAGIEADELSGCALANTGESFTLFSAPWRTLTPVIGWQDTRSGRILDELTAASKTERIRELTGLPPHSEFPAPKLDYQLSHLSESDEIKFGTVDTWIIACLAGEDHFVTDRATASRSMLIGLEDDDWSADLCELFRVPRAILPEIRPCDQMGVALRLAGRRLPLLASGYDMGLALAGHGCFDCDQVKATFGTCLGVMAATGRSRI